MCWTMTQLSTNSSLRNWWITIHGLTLSFYRSLYAIFCEMHKLKLAFCYNFCFQGNHKVSVYTSNLTIYLYLTLKSVKLYTIFLHLDSILALSPNKLPPYLLAVGTTHWIFVDHFVKHNSKPASHLIFLLEYNFYRYLARFHPKVQLFCQWKDFQMLYSN